MLNKVKLKCFLLGASRVIKARLSSARPFFISHLITARCFARCPTCLWRGETEELDTKSIINFYKDAKSNGFLATTFWGGEPLIREDIIEITDSCKKLGLVVGLITNGYLLPKYAEPLAKNLNFLIVSLDLPSNAHNRLRGVEGIFENALTGIEEIKRTNPALRVFFNSLVSRWTYPLVLEMAQFAQRLGLSVTFGSVDTGFSRFRRDGYINFRLSKRDEMEAFGKILGLKRAGMPVNNSYSLLKMFAEGRVRYTCEAPKISLTVNPNGDVSNCLNREKPLGNVHKESLRRIIKSQPLKELQRKAVHCSRCVDSGAIESSLFFGLNMEVVLNTLRLFLNT